MSLSKNSPAVTYRARWVVPVDSAPIEDGFVTVANNEIQAVGQCSNHTHKTLVDLGDSALVPGLVNAHTHLEFSDRTQPIGEPGIEFSEWIRRIIHDRRQSGLDEEQKISAIHAGLRESFQNGVWCLGEIATTPVAPASYRLRKDQGHTGSQQPFVVGFFEQLGRNPQDFSEKQRQVKDFLSSSVHDHFAPGLSPHAPYSLHPELLEWLCRTAQQHRLPLAMHLAESPAELEFLNHASGTFARLLNEFRLLENDTQRQSRSILEHLQTLAAAPRSLVIHGNFLNDSEMDFIAKHRDHMSVVYCPRTHHFFSHSRYPLEQLRARNINVALGTDSCASSPDLNFFDELKHVSQTFSRLSPLEVLNMGTLNGAIALGVDDRFGTITPGKPAALSLVRNESTVLTNSNNLQWLFAEGSTCTPLV